MAIEIVQQEQAEEKNVVREVRREVVGEINKYVLEPLELLAGLFGSCGEHSESPEEIDPMIAGRLLGLVARGAHCELRIQEEGGYAAKMIRGFLGEKLTVEL